ncbi:MAG: hypothetical protein M9894_21310 [Planctomycetes bacterium]|nr:hypothetical protein [Planctomycetota bacterium]
MTAVEWALLVFVVLATLGALLARTARRPGGVDLPVAPREAGPPPGPAPALGQGAACRRCGEALGAREGVACLACRAPHHAACWEEAQGCAACGAWPAIW